MSKRMNKRSRGKSREKQYEGVEDGMVWKPEPYPFDMVFTIVIVSFGFLWGLIQNLRKVRIHR